MGGLGNARGEGPAEPRYILTVPGRGYRFSGDLAAEAEATPEPAAEHAQSDPRAVFTGRAVYGVVAAVVLAGALLWIFARDRPAGKSPESLAVLPFRVLQPDAE